MGSRVFVQLFAFALLSTVTCFAQSPSTPNDSNPRQTSTVSAQELSMPRKAHREFEKGSALLLQGHPQPSLDHFLRAIENNPTYYGPYHNLAIAYYRLDQIDDAAKYFQKAIDLTNAGYAPSLYGLAMILYGNKEFAQAEPLLQRAMLLAPSASGTYCLGTVQLALARIHEALNNPSATIDDVRTYFRLSPNGNMKSEALAILYRAQQSQSPTPQSASLH
jgi:tetratricopeptide (TPR) repeat protein